MFFFEMSLNSDIFVLYLGSNINNNLKNTIMQYQVLTENQRMVTVSSLARKVRKIDGLENTDIYLIEENLIELKKEKGIVLYIAKLNWILNASYTLGYPFSCGRYWITPTGGGQFNVTIIGKNAGLGIVSNEFLMKRIVVDEKVDFGTNQHDLDQEFKDFDRNVLKGAV